MFLVILFDIIITFVLFDRGGYGGGAGGGYRGGRGGGSK